MRNRAATPTAVALAAMLTAAIPVRGNAAPGGSPAPADVLYVHGRIYTLDERTPWASALAVRGERIAGVGSESALAPLEGARTRIVDLRGAFVMPGFTDVHVHLGMGGQYLTAIGLRDARSMAEVLHRVAAYAASHPHVAWIQGEAWSYGYPDLPGGQFHRELLDRIVPDRPVFLDSSMAHAAWANSRALALAGITRDTPDPPGGVIVRDARGEPTGWLKEASAMALVSRHIPPPTSAERRAALLAALHEASRLGITRLDSAGFDFDALPTLAALERAGELSARIEVADVIEPPGITREHLRALEAARARYHDDLLSVVAVKFFLDGVIESHTAYLPAGYADDPRQRGLRFWDPPAYEAAVRTAAEHGFQVYTHAIGDGAIKLALDAYAQANTATAGKPPLRHRIEHLEAPDPQDLPRLGELGVIASMQPAMIYPRDQWQGMEGLWQRYAGERFLATAFALHTVLQDHAVLAFGTDWPVVDLNPLFGLRNAVLRQSLDHRPPGGYVPAERISLSQALRAYTLDAAFASHREQAEGSLVAGKLADFIILSRNIVESDPDRMLEAHVLETVLGGRVVYRAAPAP